MVIWVAHQERKGRNGSSDNPLEICAGGAAAGGAEYDGCGGRK